METVVTVELKEDGEMTELRMVSSGSPEGMASEMARAGWKSPSINWRSTWRRAA